MRLHGLYCSSKICTETCVARSCFILVPIIASKLLHVIGYNMQFVLRSSKQIADLCHVINSCSSLELSDAVSYIHVFNVYICHSVVKKSISRTRNETVPSAFS